MQCNFYVFDDVQHEIRKKENENHSKKENSLKKKSRSKLNLCANGNFIGYMKTVRITVCEKWFFIYLGLNEKM